MMTEPTPAANSSTDITEKPAAAEPTPPFPALERVPTWPLKADVVLLGLLLVLSFFLASFTAANSDLWTHLATGKRISEGKFEFGVDPYSWATEAFNDKPAVYWVHHSWLYSWLVFQLYSLVGGAGLVIGKAILFTAAIALLSRVGWNESNRWFLLIFLVMAALAASSRVLMQPIVVSLFFVSVTLFVLDRVGVFALQRGDGPRPSESEVRWLWCLPPMFALWANLDNWFILGPLLLVLAWAAAGLAKWFPTGNPVPGKTLGLVLGASVLACLLNPHHVRVFQLPPELAYLVLVLSDPTGMSLPDAMVASGRTLKEMSRIEPNSLWTVSSLSPTYWQNPNLGMHVAGIAFYPLLVLGLVAFTLVALVKPQPHAPTLHVARFLVWLFFGVMALALYQLIPFFVLVAAPLTAMTMGEFLQWQQVSNATTAARRDRGLNLARLVSIPFLLLLLYLAWPGWLHGSAGRNEFSSPRRVAWNMRPDASLQHAAESLQALQERGECGNVFNTSRELGNYFPWFAPEVKYYLDTRLSLYPGQASVYDKARKALLDPRKPAEDWQMLFAARKVDQVAIVNFMTRDPQETQKNLLRWWLDTDHWRQRFADNRTLIFSWAGLNESWPFNTAENDLNAQAFGPLAPDKRPPHTGTPPPQPPNLTTLYLDGVQPTPAQVGEGNLWQARYMLNNEQMTKYFRSCSALFMLTAQSDLASVTGGTAVVSFDFQYLFGRHVAPLDFGPPAMPILMVRGAREAVAENPLDPDSHLALLVANETLRVFQEDNWIHFQRSARSYHPSFLRDRLRNTQLLASAHTLTQLQPDNPEHHERLADLFLRQNLLDLAVEHLQLALKGYELRLASGKIATKSAKEREAVLKQYHDEKVAPLSNSVKLRLKHFNEISDRLSPLEKVNHALNKPFQEFTDKGKQQSALGLGKKALDLLLAIDPNSLSKEEQVGYLRFHFDLLLAMGRIDVVAENLQREEVRNALPSLYQLLTAAALGNYAGCDEAFPVIETELQEGIKHLAKEVNFRRTLCLPSMVVGPVPQSINTLAVALLLQTALPLNQMNEALDRQAKLDNDLYNLKTLRGILALEAGNTKQARTIFQAVLHEAGNERGFSDRPIAQRYLELLNSAGTGK